MNWDYLDPYTSELNVTHSDIDGMGHANNTCYAISVSYTHLTLPTNREV